MSFCSLGRIDYPVRYSGPMARLEGVLLIRLLSRTMKDLLFVRYAPLFVTGMVLYRWHRNHQLAPVAGCLDLISEVPRVHDMGHLVAI